MRVLTPELQCLSGLFNTVAAEDTRELDFNLARSSGIVINQIDGTLVVKERVNDATPVRMIHEIDLDPDNTAVWNATLVDAVEYDSSRVFRDLIERTDNSDTTNGVGWSEEVRIIKAVDFTNQPLAERPISITNIRHHLYTVGADVDVYSEMMIRYQIVELTMQELGILNASRR